jgi:hypothetical protein
MICNYCEDFHTAECVTDGKFVCFDCAADLLATDPFLNFQRIGE